MCLYYKATCINKMKQTVLKAMLGLSSAPGKNNLINKYSGHLLSRKEGQAYKPDKAKMCGTQMTFIKYVL